MGCQVIGLPIASRPVAKLIHERLREVRESGVSFSVLARRTPTPGDDGIGEKTIAAIEKNPGRVPDATTLRALARALDVEPDDFYEWPIALARERSAANPEAARRREADALRKRAQRKRERPGDGLDTTPAPRRQTGRDT